MTYLAQQLGLPGLVALALFLGATAAWAARSWFFTSTADQVEKGIKAAFQSDEFRTRVKGFVVEAFTDQLEPVLAAVGDLRRRVEAVEKDVVALKARGQAQRRGDLEGSPR